MSDSKNSRPLSSEHASDSGSRPVREKKDLVVLQGPTEDKKGLKILRATSDRIETGELRPLEEGKPLYGEVVELEQHKDVPFLFDVKNPTLKDEPKSQPEAALKAEPPAGDNSPSLSSLLAKELTQKWQDNQRAESKAKKPAKVTSRAYRSNWDQIWASPKQKKSDLN